VWQLLQGQNVSRRSLQDDIEEEHGDESLTSMEVREKDSETDMLDAMEFGPET
jgi:hypothetical protein